MNPDNDTTDADGRTKYRTNRTTVTLAIVAAGALAGALTLVAPQAGEPKVDVVDIQKMFVEVTN
jgi:hypothetical protein